MPRTAALLCVHNAANTLSWWISHHMAAGFSALLICDDHSTDGSQDILSQAARLYDVRITTTDKQESDTHRRRKNALERLIKQNGKDFDWLIQLAMDEYFFSTNGSVQDFFSATEAELGHEALQQTQHLPVNWCITGLNGQNFYSSQKPAPHPRALFTRHAQEHFPEHYLTRSFFRPNTTKPTLPTPFSNTKPNWSQARILHDAASSSTTPQSRRYYDRNDISFLEGKQLLSSSLDIGARLLQGMLLHAGYHIQNKYNSQDAPTSLPPELSSAPTFRRSYIQSGEDVLALHKTSYQLGFYKADSLDKDDFTRLILVHHTALPTPGSTAPAWLYPEDTLDRPFLPLVSTSETYFSMLLECLPLKIHAHDHDIELHLVPADTIFQLEGQSRFTLSAAAPAAEDEHPWQALQNFSRYGLTSQGIAHAIATTTWLSPSILGALYAHLPSQEKQQLFSPLLHNIFHPSDV